jgi:outer membrane immunogenic protein
MEDDFMKKILIGTIVLVSVGVTSVRADEDYPESWTGAYLGVNIGANFLKDETAVTPILTENSSVKDRGGSGGLQLGWNFQNGNQVFGIEGDISNLGLRSSITFTSAVGAGSLKTRYDWFASLRARAGITVNDDATMLFITGGLAATGLRMAGADPLTPVTTTNGTNSTTLFGLTVGGGVEHKLAPKWSAKADYLYASYGIHRYTLGGSAFSVKPRMHMVRLGVNRHF